MIRTCSKCGFDGDDSLFQKGRNTCKECGKKYKKAWYTEHKDSWTGYYEENKKRILECHKERHELHREEDNAKRKVKRDAVKQLKELSKDPNRTCTKCGFIGDESLFDCRICKKCVSIQQKIYKEKYYATHPEYWKERYAQNKDRMLKDSKARNHRNKDRIAAHEKTRRLIDGDRMRALERACYQVYSKTQKGKDSIKRKNSKRRQLGHKPINSWFEKSDCHHLRYNQNYQDNDITIYAPQKLHRSIHHNGRTGENMKAINVLLLQWYINSTPVEKQNSEAIKLYNNYCTLPEPKWEN
jgi:hypothetical protein